MLIESLSLPIFAIAMTIGECWLVPTTGRQLIAVSLFCDDGLFQYVHTGTGICDDENRHNYTAICMGSSLFRVIRVSVSCGNFVKKKGTNLSFSFPFLSFLPLSSACYAGGNVEGHLQQISSTTNIDIEHYNIITLAHTSYIVHELNTTVAPNSTYFTVHANSQCSKLLYHG